MNKQARKTIGERIKEKRLEKNMSLDDLAKVAEVARQTIYKYENNIVTNIPSDKIEAIAIALNVTPSYLMGWEDILPFTKREYKNNISIDLWESHKDIEQNPHHDIAVLLDLYEKLSKEQQKALIFLLKTLVKEQQK